MLTCFHDVTRRLLQHRLWVTKDDHWQAATRCCCRLSPLCCQLYVEVWPLSIGNTTWWTPLAGRTIEDHLQAGRHGVTQPARSGTSVPCQPSHFSLWCCFLALSPFCELTTTCHTLLSIWHVRPSGFLHCWSDGVELVTWQTQTEISFNSSLFSFC